MTQRAGFLHGSNLVESSAGRCHEIGALRCRARPQPLYFAARRTCPLNVVSVHDRHGWTGWNRYVNIKDGAPAKATARAQVLDEVRRLFATIPTA